MKPNRQNRFRRFGAINLLAGSVLAVLVGQQARAATLNWDPLVPPSPAIGGSGTWDATSATTNWTLGVPDGTNTGNVVWTQGSAANFTNLSGVVTLANSPQVTGLSVAAGGGTLTGSTLVVTGAGATISNAGAGGLIIASNINGLATTQPLALQGTGSNINVSGSIQGNIGTVTTSGSITLSGANGFTGALNVTGGTTNLNNTSAVTSANNLSISGGATVNVNFNNAAGTLTGTAGTTLNLNGATLTVNESSTGSIFAGALGGGAGGLILNGTSAAPLTLSGTSTTYTGVNTVNSGALLVVTATNALGIAGASTVVNTGATVTLSGGISEASAFTLNGTGVTSGFPGASATTTGSLVNVSGTNTVSGAITTPAAAGTTIYAEGGSTLNLTGGITAAAPVIGNSVTFQTGVSTNLATSTATINVPSVIGFNLDQVIKTGPGILDLTGSAGNLYLQDSNYQTVIQAGTIKINADNQLGAANNGVASTALNGVQFNGAVGATGANIPTLAVTGNVNFEQNGGGGRYFTVTSALGQFNVSSGTTSTIANGQLVFGSTTNTLNQIGSGTLVIDTTNAITGNTSVATVGTGTTSTIGGVLDVSSGGAATPTISVWGAVTGSTSSTPTGPGGYPTSGTTVLVVDGLGDATGANANGTINLGVAGHAFDSAVINLSNQSTAGLTYAGTLTTQGDLDVRNLSGTTAYNPVTNSYINPLTLSGTNTINGNVNISGAQLIVTSAGALGDSLPLSYNHATLVFGQNTTDSQSTISPGILSLTGGITVNEHITLVNNGSLDNLSGNNTITAPVGVTYNGALPYATISPASMIGGSTNGLIGATAGTLTLQNGIFGDPNSVTINGLSTDTGTVNVAGAIQSSVVNVVLGNTANTTNTVILGALNSYTGSTYLQGGNVIVGNNGAFSTGNVIVNSPTNLDSSPANVTLANNFNLTAATTLTVGYQNNSLSLSGLVSGTGGINKIGTGTLTLGGADLYSGPTVVTSGTLTVTGSIGNPAGGGSTVVNVNAGAILNTNGNALSSAATLTVSGTGTATFNGNESFNGLKLDGSLTANGNLTVVTLNDATTGTTTGSITIGANTLTAQSGTYDGSITGANGNLVKNGGGTLTLNGDTSGLTGATTVNNGILVLGTNSKLGSITLAINTGGTLTTGAGTTLSATNINIQNGGTFNVHNTLAPLATVNDSGAFNVLSGSNVIANLNVTPTGIVTLSSGLSTGGLNGGGTINLNANTLTASSGYYNGLIYGNGNVTKAGPGILTLAGANAFTGAANVTGGTLIAQTPLAATALNVSSGATYLNVGGLQNPAVVITNDGTTTLYGNEQASVYTSTGTLNGNGTLTAATYNLNGGSVVGDQAAFGQVALGTGTLNSNGAVSLFANSAANTVNVQTGVLSAGGNLGSANANINISSGAGLTLLLNPSLGINGDMVDTATVTNAGTLTLTDDDLIKSYISTGTLNGTGNTLTALTYALNNGSVVNANLGTGAVTSNNAVTLNGNSLANSVAVQTGTLTVNAGLGSANATVGISSGATLNDSGNIVDTAAVTNAGTLTLGFTATTGDTISTYVSNGGTLNGTGTLTAAATGAGVVDYALNNGSLVTGSANIGKGVLVSNGTVTIAGSSNVNAGTITVQTGTLNLTGTGTFGGDLTININSGATLNDNGTINTTAAVTNMGTLNLSANQTVASYASGDVTGGIAGDGLLSGSAGGPFTLTAATYALNNHSVVAATAALGSGTLNSNGSVLLNGNSAANFVNVQTGTLTSTGSLGVAGSKVTVSGGATLATTGTLTYGLLQGNGTVQKSLLTNTSTVNPGIGTGATGTLTIAGNYSEKGTLQIDLARSGAGAVLNDQLAVTGQVTLTSLGTLKLQQVGGFEMARTESARVIMAGTYAGTIGAFDTTAFQNRMLFDNTDGIVYGTGVNQGQNLGVIAGLGHNQSNVAAALDAGSITAQNFIDGTTTLGAATIAMLGSANPGAVLDQLSPEGYAGFTDYAMHVTHAYSAAAMEGMPATVSGDLAVFAGYSHYSVNSAGGSTSLADYDLNSNGGLVGARYHMCDLTIGGFAAADSGSVSNAFIHSDVSGFDLGAFANYQLQKENAIALNGGVTYGNYDFSGHRNSLDGGAGIHGGQTDVFDIHLGASGDAFRTEKFRLSPGLGLDYLTSRMQAIHESGAGTSLNVNSRSEDAFLAEIALNAEYKVTSKASVLGKIAYTRNFSGTSRNLGASFAAGGPVFNVTAPGFDQDVLALGLGGSYSITDSVSLGLNYRAEFGTGARMANVLNVGSSFSF